MSESASRAFSLEGLLEQVMGEAPVRNSWLARRLTPISIVIQASLDFLTVLAALSIAYKGYRLLDLGLHVYYPRSQYLLIASAVAAGFVLLLERYELYRPDSSLLHIRETEAILRGAALSMAVFFISAYALFRFAPSRWIIALAFVLVVVLVLAQRVICYGILGRLHRRGYGVDRVLIVGASQAGTQIFRKLAQSPRAGLIPVAFVDDTIARGTRVYESAYQRRKFLPVVGTSDELEAILRRLQVTRLILTDESKPLEFERISTICEREGVRISFVPLQYRTNQHQVAYQDFDGVMLAEIRPVQETAVFRATKRLFDVVLASLFLLGLSPVLAVIGAVILITDGRPVFFRQDRAGHFGKVFRMFKFRSMYRDAPAYAHCPKDTADPRITPVGRFLRRTSLDELPQLFNVLRGEMSLVGPRPEMPFIVEKYTPAQRERLLAKPGLTGLWQISADRAFEIHENIDYDLYYIRNRSLLLDIVILLHTAIFAIRGVGAF
jgi:exopolysaccharide biosynthesis polyprenyl glycosylphosphotransferase